MAVADGSVGYAALGGLLTLGSCFYVAAVLSTSVQLVPGLVVVRQLWRTTRFPGAASQVSLHTPTRLRGDQRSLLLSPVARSKGTVELRLRWFPPGERNELVAAVKAVLRDGDAFIPDLLEAFSFLFERGFDIAEVRDGEVRFESDEVLVRVTHDWNDWGLGLRVGRLDAPKDAVTRVELLEVAGHPTTHGLFARDPGDARPQLDALADELLRYGDRALAGDPAVFEAAAALRRACTARYKDPPGATGR